MVKLTDIIHDMILKKKSYIYLLIAFIFIIICVYSFKYIYKGSKKDDTNDITNANRRKNIANIYFFNADWCPHCTKALPAWRDFVNSYDQTDVHGYTINCVGGKSGVNCSSTDDPQIMETIQKFNVEHYPTLKMVKDDTTIDFDAKITQENLKTFINTIL
jgi:thiol-disulfide isomerase/thioredoxin